jgi:type II secretion system protein N
MESRETQTALRQKMLAWTAYAAFFCFCFTLFAYWTFPYDRLRDYLLQKANQESTAGGKKAKYQLQIASLEPWWFTGVRLTGIEMTKPPETEGAEPVRFKADRITIRPSLIPLLAGRPDLSFDLRLGSGRIKGRYKKDENTLLLESDIEAFAVAESGLGGLIGLPVKGRADGSIKLFVPKKLEASQGNIRLKISKLSVGDGKAKLVTKDLKEGMTVETIEAGDLDLQISVRKGIGEVEKLSASGADLQLQGSGNIRLLQEISSSRLNLILDIKFTDAYRKRNDRTRALFELMNLNPQMRKAKTREGSLRYRISGVLARPSYRAIGDRNLRRTRRKAYR